MWKQIRLNKYKVSVPVSTRVDFYVLADTPENAIKYAQESSPGISWDGIDRYTVADALFYTDEFRQDAIPHYATGFKDPELPTGFKYEYSQIDTSTFGLCFKGATVEEQGCLIDYVGQLDED